MKCELVSSEKSFLLLETKGSFGSHGISFVFAGSTNRAGSQSPAASLDEIHEAYRSKSKKHHPDLGGDEWAFRMVTRAYEVLKTTTTTPSKPWAADSQFDTRPELQPDAERRADTEPGWHSRNSEPSTSS